MTGLVIDTSTQKLLLGIQKPDGSEHLYQQASQGNHAGDILERIRPLVAGLRIDRIGVALGPGSFTGLRIGLAVAKGLAEGWDCPLFGLDNLAAMARAFYRLYPVTDAAVLSIIDARKKRFYGSLTRGAEVLIAASDWSPAEWLSGCRQVWPGRVAVSGFQGDLLAREWGDLPAGWEVLPLHDWTRELLRELADQGPEHRLSPAAGPRYLRLSEAEELRLAKDRGSDGPLRRGDSSEVLPEA